MEYQELINHFGGLSKAGNAIGADRRLVHHWRTHRIPSHWQAKIEAVTEGLLKADEKAQEVARAFTRIAQRV